MVAHEGIVNFQHAPPFSFTSFSPTAYEAVEAFRYT